MAPAARPRCPPRLREASRAMALAIPGGRHHTPKAHAHDVSCALAAILRYGVRE
ncbi:hypothetical protein [Streptomyces sp. NPDC051776]|uniref:hypothetical protein n=1 Tax=Streptomyces sp. NPDC051776 TaxID=3155414 RepID=UPI00341DA373